MGPLPSGSGTSRNRPRPETSDSSETPQRTQRRRRPLEGGNGTGQQCAPPRPVARVFVPGPVDYLEAAAAVVLDEPVLELEPEDDDELPDEAAGAEVDEAVEEGAEDEEEEDDSPFLVELYRSEYQPPPLSTKEERLTILLSEPSLPQWSHLPGAGSFTFWMTSVTLAQVAQVYS